MSTQPSANSSSQSSWSIPSHADHQEDAADRSQQYIATQIEPSSYLSPHSHRRTKSVDGGRRENDYIIDTSSISSTRSLRSKLSRFKKRVSRLFSEDQDVETSTITSTSTPPPSVTITTSPPTNVAVSAPALKSEAVVNHPAQETVTAIPEFNITGLPFDAVTPITSVSTPAPTSMTATTTSYTVMMATPPLKPESVTSATLHRIDTAIPEVNVNSVPLGPRCSSQSSRSANDTIAVPATPVSISQTPPAHSSSADSRSIEIFPKNICMLSPNISLPRSRLRIESTPQLAFCIGLLRADQLPPVASANNNEVTISSQDKAVDTLNRQWIRATMQSPVEHQFIIKLTPKLVAAFVEDANKNSTAIAEIVLLAQALDREHYRILLNCFIAEFNRSCILGIKILQGLVHLVQSTSPGFLDSDDLVKILASLSTSLQDTHQQSSLHPYHLTLAVSQVLDVMADHKVQELNRVNLHEPLSAVLLGLKHSTDPYLMYQACYAFQALQRVPDDETALQSFLRHSTGMADGLIKVSGLVQLNFAGFMEGLKEVQEVVEKTASTIKSAFEGMMSLVESGRGILNSAKEGLGSGHKRQWYLAVRGATRLVQEGRFADLRILVTDAPCRLDPLFQMGICQLLGEIADASDWDVDSRMQAIDFIEKLCLNDQDWGQDESVKQWMWTIICRVSRAQDRAVKDHALILVNKMRGDGYAEISSESPLRSRLSLPDSYPLLNRAQEIPNIEMDVCRMMMNQLECHWGQELSVTVPVYIPPQAKASLQEPDTVHFPLMEEVESFLRSERLVLLLLGDAGAGKTTFNHKLAFDLCEKYTVGGPIPLFVSLPLCTRPDDDMIAEELRRYRFSEAQIKELERQQRQFVLICDGYDERQLNTNLHTTNRLNQPGRWKAKLIVSCRSQYLKREYLHNFRPTPTRPSHRNAASDLFQEAVIVPFTEDQIEDYVKQFVDLPNETLLFKDRPQWSADDYMKRLYKIPNLMDMVGNPFLLSVSLQVLHQIIGTNTDLATVRVTSVELYDIFVKEWVARGERRLRDRKLPTDEQEALEKFINDRISFTQHAINFMKTLSTLIFDNQAKDNSTIEYSQLTDGGTWKAEHFQKSAKNRLFLETSLLVGTGIEFRFLHRSLLEYFYSLVFFDPNEGITPESSNSNDISGYQAFQDSLKTVALSKTSIVEEPLVVQFLAERARTVPQLEQLLVDLMDTNVTDDESYQGAINARAILIAADIPYRGVDLRTISDQYD